MKRLLCSLLGFLMVALAAQAQTSTEERIEDALKRLEEKALKVHITARVIDDGEQTVWNMELTRITISGRAVKVRLEGSNIVVVAHFTPYRESGNSILLVAQGQTWLSTPGSENVEYQTSFESLPIRLGEPVVFLPLGDKPLDVKLDSERYGMFNIELEVNVVAYEGRAG